MKVISLDSFENNSLSVEEANKILSDLYADLNSRYSVDLYNCFEDESSPAYKFVNLLTNIPDNGVEESKLYMMFLYLYKTLKISLSDLLEYLDENGYSHENLKEWLENNAYYISGLKVTEFYNYINGYSYNGTSVVAYIDKTLLKNTKYVRNSIIKDAYKYKLYPNGIRYSTNPTYFRNYREVYDRYDRIMKEKRSMTFSTIKIPDEYKDEMVNLLHRTRDYGILGDRALLQTTENSTTIFFKDSLLNSKMYYILEDEYYISTIRDDATKLLDEFIIYFVNHLKEFGLDSYDEIDFGKHLQTYIDKYIDILLNTKNILHIHKITFFLLLLKMFDPASIDQDSITNRLKKIDDMMNIFDSFKAFLSGMLDSIAKAEEGKSPRFIIKK